MAKFTDSAGRSWEPEVNVVTIGRVRDGLKINLLELLLPNSTLAEKLNDPCLLVDVLYLLCKDDADARGLSDIEFGKAQTMDGIEDAWSAVLEGLVLFSPRGLRPAHQKVLEKARKYQAVATEQVKLLAEHPEFDAMLETEIARRLNPPTTLPSESTGDAGNSPESSELSPAITPWLV